MTASLKIYDSDVFVLPLPDGHRFPMQKYRRLRERVAGSSIPAELHVPPAATDEELMLVHERGYIDRVARGELSDVEIRRIGFPWSEAMVERSRRSTGATIAAARTAIDEGIAGNLAGGTHHAGRSRGQGYCVFNDAAVACATLLAEQKIRSAAVIDTDVHQGNGTAEIFADDDRVTTFSIHGEKNFPAKKHAGDIDISLAPGTSDDAYLAALEKGLVDLFFMGRPDLIVFTSGADPYVDDTLGSLALSKSGLRKRDEIVLTACHELRCPVAVTMAGGYSHDVTDIVDIHFATLAASARYRAAWVGDARLPTSEYPS